MQQTRTRIHPLLCGLTAAACLLACGSGQKATTGNATATANDDQAPTTADVPHSKEPVANAPKEADPGTMSNEEKAQKAIALLKSLVSAAVAGQGDCDAAAAGMNQWFTDNRALWNDAKAWDQDPTFKKLMKDNYSDEFTEIMKPLAAIGERCWESEAFSAAIQRLAD